MKKNSHLYHALKTWMGQSESWAHLGHLTTCLWMIVALIHTGEVNLTRWLPYIPCRGNQAQSKQRRLSRWLHNSRINVHRLYKGYGNDPDEKVSHLARTLIWKEFKAYYIATSAAS